MAKNNTNKTDINTGFETQLISFIKKVYPEYYSPSLIKEKSILEKTESFFKNLAKVYEEREKYNLHWAFKEAQNTFDNLSSTLYQAQKDYLDEKLKKWSKEEVANYTEALSSIRENNKNYIKKKSQLFSILSFVIFVLDIVISILLIVGITMVSHIGDHLFHSALAGVLFITIVAFMKVSFDRFFVMPKVDKWGWKKYLDTINSLEKRMIIIRATQIVLVESIERKDKRNITLQLLEKGISHIKE